MEVACKECDLLDVRLLGVHRQIADLHVLEHAQTKRSHGKLLCRMDSLQAATPWSRKEAYVWEQDVKSNPDGSPLLQTERRPDSYRWQDVRTMGFVWRAGVPSW